MTTTVCGVAVTLLLQASAIASEKPDFSGAWALDQDRSFSNPPGFNQTMTVTQNGNEIKLDAKVTTAQGEQAISERFILDGQERDFTPPAGPQGAKGRRKAYWLPGDRGIVVEDQVTTDSPSGPVSQSTIRKWILSADGKTLTADYFIDSPRGSGQSKRIFVRK
ncbi:MAG TPA: hypothetical protein VFV34_08635 [Blastocatellia bacterium]|nr:hypothetical protein [Blastocatellia bacterium]